MIATYGFPTGEEAVQVLQRRLAGMDTSTLRWGLVTKRASGLSHAELVKAAEAAAKRAILADRDVVDEQLLLEALSERHATHHA
jgi:AAA+ superfamily predicted ATPase